MLPGMIEIHDLNRAGKVLVRQIPDPDSPVSEDDSDSGPLPTSAPSFGIDAVSELVGCFDSADIGCGIGVVDPVDSRAGQLIQDKVCVQLR